MRRVDVWVRLTITEDPLMPWEEDDDMVLKRVREEHIFMDEEAQRETNDHFELLDIKLTHLDDSSLHPTDAQIDRLLAALDEGGGNEESSA